MAVVFISPKQRQKVFLMGITLTFLLILIFISLAVFLSGPKYVPPAMVFNKPKVDVNTKIFETDQFKDLQPFIEIETQYSYKAITKSQKLQTGFISATSEEQAKTILKSMGLTVSEVKEVQLGRDNPFTPYYSIPKSTTTTRR